MVHLPTFGCFSWYNAGKYTIHGCYGPWVITMFLQLSNKNHNPTILKSSQYQTYGLCSPVLNPPLLHEQRQKPGRGSTG